MKKLSAPIPAMLLALIALATTVQRAEAQRHYLGEPITFSDEYFAPYRHHVYAGYYSGYPYAGYWYGYGYWPRTTAYYGVGYGDHYGDAYFHAPRHSYFYTQQPYAIRAYVDPYEPGGYKIVRPPRKGNYVKHRSVKHAFKDRARF